MISLLKKLSKTGLPIISCSGFPIPKTLKIPKMIRRKMIDVQNLDRYEKVLYKIPEATFIFAHGGCMQNEKLIELMIKFPNTYTDISTQPPINIRRMIDKIGSQRLLFGSDYPVFNQSFPIVAVLRATENEKDRKAIFAENAKKVLSLNNKPHFA